MYLMKVTLEIIEFYQFALILNSLTTFSNFSEYFRLLPCRISKTFEETVEESGKTKNFMLEFCICDTEYNMCYCQNKNVNALKHSEVFSNPQSKAYDLYSYRQASKMTCVAGL